MSKALRRAVGRFMGISVSAALAATGVVALRHALETPQPLKSPLPGEALLYRWQRRSIFYKLLGPAEAPPLVLLHSPDIGASAREMQCIMSPLAQTYRVYALDLLGFGLSDRPNIEYSAALYSALCQDFLHEVVKEPATLLASGLSCNYVVAAAANAPELCAALVLISPVALQGRPQLIPLSEFADAPPVKALLYPLLSTRPGFALTHGRQQYERTDFAQFYANTHQLGAEHATMALLAGKLTEDSTRQFESLQQPVLLIWGMQALEDQRTIASMHEAAALADPTRRTREVELIPKAGLAVHEEQPEAVAAAIKRWQAAITAELPSAAESRAFTLPSGGQHERQITEEPVILSDTQPRAETIQTSQAPVFDEPGALSEEDAPAITDEVGPLTSSEEATSVATGEAEPTAQPEENILATDETEADASSVEDATPEPHTVPVENENQPASPAEQAASAKPIMAYCVKCKQKREMKNARAVTMKNGRRATRGTCAICGTTLNRIGG